MEWRGKLSAGVAIPFMLACGIAYHASAEVIEITVTDKVEDVEPSTDDEPPQARLLVYTDRGVFKVGWEPLYLDFRPAERYRALEIGQRYRVRVAGWRVPATNWYRRIVSIVG